MTLQIFRDGRPDKRVDGNKLAQLQRHDDYTQALKQHLERDAGDGTYGFMGVMSDPSRGLTVPKATIGGISRAERIARVRARMAAGEPPISLYYDEQTNTEILALEDAEAYEEGWICPNCIQYQGVVSNECNWRVVGGTPVDPNERGCGHRRKIF